VITEKKRNKKLSNDAENNTAVASAGSKNLVQARKRIGPTVQLLHPHVARRIKRWRVLQLKTTNYWNKNLRQELKTRR